jgi:hypothetical protein
MPAMSATDSVVTSPPDTTPAESSVAITPRLTPSR